MRSARVSVIALKDLRAPFDEIATAGVIVAYVRQVGAFRRVDAHTLNAIEFRASIRS